MTVQISPASKTIRAFVAVSLLLLVFVAAQAQAKPPYDKATLINGLKQSAKDKKLTADDFVRLIQERGVTFQITTRDEADLRIAGATNEIIAAIRQNYRWAGNVPSVRLPRGAGALTINSRAGVSVLVNGKLRGTTNDGGTLTISPLKAGPYKILLKKEGFEDEERSVIVSVGLEANEAVDLSPIKGQLTVIPNVTGAQIRLNGIEYPTGINGLSIPAQSYEVRVSKPGYRIFTKTVTVTPHSSTSVDASLAPIPVEEMLSQASASIQQQRFNDAIVLLRELLSAKPDEPKANLLMGSSYFGSGRYGEGIPYLAKAVSLGEQIRIPIQHHRTSFGVGDDLCAGQLLIDQNSFGFRSSGCGRDFQVPLANIYELKPEPNNRGGRLHVKVGISKGVKVDKKGQAKEEIDRQEYNFHSQGASLIHRVPGDPNSLVTVYCSDCLPTIMGIYELIQQVRQPMSGRPTLKRRDPTTP